MPDEDFRKSAGHHDVFISYAQEDKPVANAVCARLESHNIRCWIAPRDIAPGKVFPEAIIEGIEEGKVLVVIFSSFANKSPHVTREVTNAVNKGRIIIPFRIEDVQPSKSMEYLMSVPHWLDAVTPPLEDHIEVLIKTIGVILETDKITASSLAQATIDTAKKTVTPPSPPSRSPDPEIPKNEKSADYIPLQPAISPVLTSKNLLVAGIILVGLIVVVLGFSTGLLVLMPPGTQASGQAKITGTIPPGMSEDDYYRSSGANVNTVILTTQPTQTLAKETELNIATSKDSTNAVVTVQFTGGPGIGRVIDNRIILTRSDGTVTERKIDFNQRLSEVQLQGTRGTDRLQVIVTTNSGETKNIIDILLPYRQF